MMCRHEFITATKGWMDKDKSMYPISELMKICKNCRKTVGEIDLEQQLAAAKAELAAEREKRESLEKQNKELFPYYQDHLEGALIPATEYQKWIKRAEQAEAQCAYWENKCKELTDGR